MKLLTLNCHSWIEKNQIEKIKTIVNTILEKKYDVIALQEINQSIKEEIIYGNVKKDNFALILIQELQKLGCDKYTMIWEFSHIGYDKYEEGVALLIRHTVQEECSVFLTNSENREFWKTRKALKATIKVDEKIIDFYSCHMGWWKDEEEPFQIQADKLIDITKTNRLTFFMGDFNNNAYVKGEGYDYLIQKGLKDTFMMAKERDKGITVKGEIDGWSSNEKNLRLDLILTNKEIEVKYSNVIFNGLNKNVVSDHYGVEIEFKI